MNREQKREMAMVIRAAFKERIKKELLDASGSVLNSPNIPKHSLLHFLARETTVIFTKKANSYPLAAHLWREAGNEVLRDLRGL